MRVLVAGAHGKIARLLTRHLSADGHEVVGLVRDPGQVPDLESDGARGVVVDLERAGADDVAAVAQGCDAVVFAAGAGPGSGAARKDTVDRGAAVLLADGAEAAGVRPYVLVSSTGVGAMQDGALPDDVGDVFLAYLQAKAAAEDDVLARPGLAAVAVRPGSLTDEAATGRLHLTTGDVDGSVPRADVAALCAALLGRLVDGEVVAPAVVGVVAGDDDLGTALEGILSRT
ncbi:NAD(P)H-binding protein [Aquipuribacter nitratireducens]|uniref:NAD(P)H-binding protein n=1 Tax=Aquipuribacter nitratireducens TaxID=650104 RepID=A0ABW0GIU6_9MICO